MLKLHNVSFSYGKKDVIKNLNLQLDTGEILAVMGPSGCGKSTLLSLIAGLRKPTEGTIESEHTRISVVFQEPRLFPWLTVRENLSAPLEHPEESDKDIREALEAVGLSECAQLYPRELSGGMKSRVSLARALVYGGDLFLFDEPFSALDESLRETLASRLRTYLKTRGASAILVTHQADDAERLADRTLLLSPH